MDQPSLHARASAVPPGVAELAAEHRLGHPRISHGEPGPLTNLMLAVAVALGSFGILAFVTWTELGVLRPVAIIGVAGLVIAVILVLRAVKVAVTGRRMCHLFTHGFVYRRNWRLQAVTWPEVKVITRAYAGRNRTVLDRYNVFLHDDTKLVLVAGTADEAGKRFVSEIEHDIAQHGVTTVESLVPPIEQRQRGVPPGPSAPIEGPPGRPGRP